MIPKRDRIGDRRSLTDGEMKKMLGEKAFIDFLKDRAALNLGSAMGCKKKAEREKYLGLYFKDMCDAIFESVKLELKYHAG
ncbi:hypothetical protein ES702_05895 [subsurface metagenome]